MAEGARRHFGVDIALSATGVAGPEGGTEEKPVGTVFVALAREEETVALRLQLPGDRATIRSSTAIAILDLLRRRLG